MLCSSSQFCSHYAHATIPIMPALCSNLKDTAAHMYSETSIYSGYMVQVKIKFHCIFVVLSS